MSNFQSVTDLLIELVFFLKKKKKSWHFSLFNSALSIPEESYTVHGLMFYDFNTKKFKDRQRMNLVEKESDLQ